ncbi:MAG: DUF1778 domain-containing protein [Methylococcales bacterium]|jgi:uncharacterized protein (DUF1778 family)|nr:DUF1778 domain-containing protein [Methylococcales bacterium]MBT7442937.1 DUF1778 domain-containing protein [Methylococcales bacterium]
MGNALVEHDMAKTESIFFKASPEQKTLINQAASILNKQKTEFMLQTLCDRAEEVILDQQVVMLAPDEFKAFQQALDEPLDQVKVDDLLQRKGPWE